MKDFYYQIKGKIGEPEEGLYGGTQNWTFPPIFVGKVTAPDKKEAKRMIDEEYGKVFPLRVLSKDLDSNEFLLSIEEIKEGSRTQRLFEKQTCLHCSGSFYIADNYNNHNETYKGSEFCSDRCKSEAKGVRDALYSQNIELKGNSNPVIYKITNKDDNWCYIGKTNQVFTLRWYQHFFQGGDCKFHAARRNSKLSDWVFEIIEIIHIPEDIKTVSDIGKLIIDRERFWINHYNSIVTGYNSI